MSDQAANPELPDDFGVPIEPEAPPTAPRSRRFLWFELSSTMTLLVVIVVHVLGLGLTTLVVVAVMQARKQQFIGQPKVPNPGTRAIEHSTRMAKKKSAMSAPQMPRRIT